MQDASIPFLQLLGCHLFGKVLGDWAALVARLTMATGSQFLLNQAGLAVMTNE